MTSKQIFVSRINSPFHIMTGRVYLTDTCDNQSCHLGAAPSEIDNDPYPHPSHQSNTTKDLSIHGSA